MRGGRAEESQINVKTKQQGIKKKIRGRDEEWKDKN